jgi:hypothetical protein
LPTPVGPLKEIADRLDRIADPERAKRIARR